MIHINNTYTYIYIYIYITNKINYKTNKQI